MKVHSEHKLDLELLMKAAQDNELRVLKTGEDVYIDWEMLRPRMPFGPASHAAEAFLPVLNGMLATRFPAFRGLKLISILGRADDGRPIPVSWKSFTIVSAGHTQDALSFLQSGGETLGRFYQLAKTNAAVAEATLYFGRNNEPFFDLYKAFEVIRDTVGGQQRLQALGLVRADECERFTRSANDPTISGVFARHSQKQVVPVADPMNEQEARDFVRRLLVTWINQLSADTN